jgi:hypothetical protein
MKMFQFIKYTAVANEKHCGFATIKCNFKFLLKDLSEITTKKELQEALLDATEYKIFRISPGKNGGYFPNMASYKINDAYEESCAMDSNFIINEMKKVIMEGVHDEMNKTGTQKMPTQESIFPIQSSYQPKQNDDCPF